MKSSRASIASLMVLACVSAAAILVARMHVRSASGSTLIVKAVAHQWWWEFDYPSLGIKTSDVLYVPSATNVRLELASADVIHSFWIAGMKESVEIFGALAIALISVVFFSALLSALARGLTLDCGCFGVGAPSRQKMWLELALDVVLACGALLIYLRSTKGGRCSG